MKNRIIAKVIKVHPHDSEIDIIGEKTFKTFTLHPYSALIGIVLNTEWKSEGMVLVVFLDIKLGKLVQFSITEQSLYDNVLSVIKCECFECMSI